MIDYSKYIGIDYKLGGRSIKEGLDCYGLVLEFYKNEYGIILPDFKGVFSDARTRTMHGTDGKNLKDVYDESMQEEFFEVEDSKEGDILAFTLSGVPIHLGIRIDDFLMLHTFKEGSTSCIEQYRGFKWEKRFYGAYRHKNLM